MMRPNARLAATGLATIGVGARLAHFVHDRPLWTDEAALAINLIARSATALVTRPLSEGQVAPTGFLLAERAAVVGLGTSELALRAIPFAASVASLLLFCHVADELFDGVAAVIAIGLVATAPTLVYYAAEVKQYSTDVLAAVLMLAVAVPVLRGDRSTRRMASLGIAGTIVVWISQPAVFILAGVAAALLTSILLASASTSPGDRPYTVRRLPFAPIVAMMVIWSASSVTMILLAQQAIGAADRTYLDHYWAAGFLPLPPQSLHDLLWLPRVGRELFRDALPSALPWGAFGVALIGVIALGAANRPIAVMMLATVTAAIAASALHAYPVAGRLAIFLVPLLALAEAAGIGAIVSTTGMYQARVALIAAALVLAAPLWMLPRATTVREDLRTVVGRLAAARRPGDVVYVYYAAQAAFHYYTARLGMAITPLVIGTCARTEWRAYLADLDRLRGRPRVWVVASHIYHGRVDEDSLFTDYLLRIGGPPRAAFAGRDSWARLYDLSDTSAATTRLAHAFVPAFTDQPPAPAYSCGPTPTVAAP